MAGSVSDMARRAARIAALNVKLNNGSITQAERDELNKLLAEQAGTGAAPKAAKTPAEEFTELSAKVSSGKATPAEQARLKELLAKAPEMQPGYVPPKSPEQAKAEFDAMRAKAAKAATTSGATIPPDQAGKGIARPTGPAPEGQQWVEGPTGWVLAPIAKPEDMVVNPELPILPGYARTPSGEVVPADQSGQTGRENPALYPKTEAAAPAPAATPAAPTPAAAPVATPESPYDPGARGYGDRTREFEEAMDAADVDAIKGAAVTVDAAKADPSSTPADVKKATSSFTGTAKDLAQKYGIPLLAIIQAFAYGQAGYKPGTVPTIMDQKYQEKLDAEQKEYAKKLEEDRRAWESSQAQVQIKAEADLAAANRAFQADQAALDRLLRKEELGQQLSSEEKIAKMQLEARVAAARTSGTPETPTSVADFYGGY